MDLLTPYLEKTKQEISGIVTEFGPPITGTPDAPTEKQINFYKSLVMGKDLIDTQRYQLMTNLSKLTRKTISDTISWLVGIPWKKKEVVVNTPVAPQIRTVTLNPGRYAINHPSGELRFYQIDRPVQGRWAGVVFLSQLSGENHIAIRDRTEKDFIFSLIAMNPTESLKLYGQKIGRCGHCKKTLTDQVSRDFGIGPVCRKVLGI